MKIDEEEFLRILERHPGGSLPDIELRHLLDPEDEAFRHLMYPEEEAV